MCQSTINSNSVDFPPSEKERERDRAREKTSGLLSWWVSYCSRRVFTLAGRILLELLNKDRFTYMAVPLVMACVIIRMWLLGILLDLEIEG